MSIIAHVTSRLNKFFRLQDQNGGLGRYLLPEKRQRYFTRMRSRRCISTEVPDLIAWRHDSVPALDQRLVHLERARERPLVDVDGAMIAEVGVSGEEHEGHVQ